MIIKPPLGTQIHAGHPFAKGIRGCWLLNEGVSNNAYDISSYNTTAIITGATRAGQGLKFATNADVLNFGSGEFGIVDSQEFTIVIGFNLTSFANADNIWSRSGFIQPFLCVGESGLIKFYVASSGGSPPVSATVPSLNANHQIVCTFKAGISQSIYMDGSLEGNTVPSGTLSFIAGRELTIGLPQYGGVSLNGKVYYCYLYDRCFNAGEVVSMSIDPYAMFRENNIDLWESLQGTGGIVVLRRRRECA